MIKLHIPLLLLAVVIPLTSPSVSWAVINNNATPGSGTGEGEGACLAWCGQHNKTNASVSKCMMQCEVYWCRNGKCGLKDEPAAAKPGGGPSIGPTNPLPPNTPPPAKAQ
jgi:hypothetical protein